MPATPGGGLGVLVEILARESMRRGTGTIEVAGEGSIQLVFGHPLHAVAGECVGMDAVRRLADRLRDQPVLDVAWLPGRAGANQNSLEPGDAVLDHLRAAHASTGASGRERAAEVVDEVCASLEARLHRHAAPLTAAIRAAPLEQAALVAVIRRLRSSPQRAVSPEAVSQLLDEAEAAMRQRLPLD